MLYLIGSALHLSCHPARGVLASVHERFGSLRFSCVILSHICSNACVDGWKAQCLVAVGNRANLSGDGARARWLVKRTTLENLSEPWKNNISEWETDLRSLDLSCILLGDMTLGLPRDLIQLRVKVHLPHCQTLRRC